jgi:hypothetical protein
MAAKIVLLNLDLVRELKTLKTTVESTQLVISTKFRGLHRMRALLMKFSDYKELRSFFWLASHC